MLFSDKQNYNQVNWNYMAKSRCQLKCFEFSEKLLHFHILSALKHQFFLCYCFQLNKVKERNIRSICRQQLFRSLRAHQYSSDQMKILKDQSAQTTARVVVSVAYRLWLPFLINRVLNLTIPHPRNGVILYIYCHSALICVPILYL